MISDSTLDRIQDSVSLVELFEREGIQLKATGKDKFACCPFHDEKTPSLSVNDRFFHCLGCGEHGNHFQFLMKHKKVSFIEAVKQVAVMGKVPLDSIDFGEAQIQHETTEKRDKILAAAVAYWKRTYKSTKEAKKYIKSRGISAQVAEQYEVGYDDGELKGHLIADCGFDLRDLRTMGLVNEKGNDRFWGRVVFPIYKDDRVVNVCGRSLQNDANIKYLNLHENEGVFNFNLGRREREVWAVEGVIDALVMISNGVPNVVAHLGTQGFKDSYLNALKRSGVSRLLLLPDHDEPKGSAKFPESYKTAAVTSARALNQGLDVMVGEIPEAGEDPADFFSNTGSTDKIKLFEPLRWVRERTAISDPILVARRLSPLGAGPDVSKEFEMAVGGQKWRMLKSSQTSSGLKGCLLIENKKGREVFKDHVDLWSTTRRRSISKEVGLDEEIVNIICSVLEKQFDTISILDREERRAYKIAKSKNALPEYAEELAAELRNSPTLLEDIRNDVTSMGYVGEDINKVLLYLIGLSAKMTEPLGCFIASDSGAGKSALVEVVVKLFPNDHVHLISRMTDQALYYMDEHGLKNKWLIVAERSGIEQSEAADFNLRTFFSEKKLVLLRPEKNEVTGTFESKTHTVYGPIAYTETTTALGVHDENATRLIEMNIRESDDQTAAVHDYQRNMVMMDTASARALDKARKRLVMKHKAFINSLKQVEVRIPYADRITFPTNLTRARRDLLKFLNLIKTIAFAHQFQREIVEEDGVSFVDATVEDYEMAYHLSKDAIRKAFSAVPERSMDLLQEIFQVLKDSKTGLIDIEDDELSTFTIKDLIDAGVKRSPPTIRKYLAPLMDQDIVEPMGQGGRGRGNVSRFKVKIAALDDAVDVSAKEIIKPKKMRELVGAAPKRKVKVGDEFDFNA